MKISFNGNHLYKCRNMYDVIGLTERYRKIKENTNKNMIIYGDNNDDYYVHVIDGKDARNFRIAQQMNKGVVKEPYLFEALAKAYREKATVVNFADIPQEGKNISNA